VIPCQRLSVFRFFFFGNTCMDVRVRSPLTMKQGCHQHLMITM
jgi:hypothetical protein